MSFKTINLLSNLNFDGEGNVSTFMHLNQFNIARNNLKIVRDNEICRLFILTLEGHIKS
jgi:hypothetical protein